MSFVICEHAALSPELCDELINMWDRAAVTEVFNPDENRSDLVQPIPEHEDFKEISYVSIIQYPEGTHMPFHRDNADDLDTGTVIFNLNDEFKGGNFHVDGHTFIPFLGNMIAFNDSVNRWHGVDPVFGEERFSLCIWYTDPDRVPEEDGDDNQDEPQEQQEQQSEKKHSYAILPE